MILLESRCSSFAKVQFLSWSSGVHITHHKSQQKTFAIFELGPGLIINICLQYLYAARYLLPKIHSIQTEEKIYVQTIEIFKNIDYQIKLI